MGFELKTAIFGTTSVALFGLMVWLGTSKKLDKAVALLDHLGKIGHREIARSYSACMKALFSAGGAGLITAGTVVLKLLILHASFTLLGAGFLVSLNFALSFLFMQAFGFKLATKLAPLLGVTLGRRYQELRQGLKRVHLREEIGWSFRTQFFSALGNLVFVVPAIFVFHGIFHSASGAAFMDHDSARAVLQSLHPWKSGTLPYAALTGVLLWFCTMTGGAVAGRLWPSSKTATTALFNIFLGVLLAFVPIYGLKTGLALDVRHFTLSSGLVALAVASLGFRSALEAGLAAAFASVILIGVLNFSVSFALAFLTSWLDERWKGNLSPAAAPFPR
jgi:site-specific recombinase